MCCGLKLQKMDAHFYAASWGEIKPPKNFHQHSFLYKKKLYFCSPKF